MYMSMCSLNWQQQQQQQQHQQQIGNYRYLLPSAVQKTYFDWNYRCQIFPMAQGTSVVDHKEIFPFSTHMHFSPTVWLQLMLYPLENEEQGINTRVFTWVFNCVMRVLECANKLLEILAQNDLPPKLRWSENGDF